MPCWSGRRVARRKGQVPNQVLKQDPTQAQTPSPFQPGSADRGLCGALTGSSKRTPEVKSHCRLYKGMVGKKLRPSSFRSGHDTSQEIVPLRWSSDASSAQCSHSRDSDQFSCFYVFPKLSMIESGLYLWLINNQKLAVSALI